MLKKLNRNGFVPIQMLIVMAIVAGITTLGLTKTAKDGTLKKNGKIIWCKMQNKGNDFCDAQYQ